MKKTDFSNLKAMYINCTLKKSPSESHTSKLMDVSKQIMQKENVTVEEIRLVDHNVASGVYPDMTEHGWEKDEWPELFKKIIDADILIMGTPIWLGEKSSIAQKTYRKTLCYERYDKREGTIFVLRKSWRHYYYR